MSKIIHLLRHGAIDGPAGLYGRTDISVTAKGMAAMQQQLNALAPMQRIFTSPLKRCAAFAFKQQQNAIVIDDLAEMDFGQWDGLSFDQLQSDWPKVEQLYQDPLAFPPPYGETLNGFRQRVSEAWLQICDRAVSGHNLVVCHGGVIRMILAEVLQLDSNNSRWFSALAIDYASLCRVEIPGHPNALPLIKSINKEYC